MANLAAENSKLTLLKSYLNDDNTKVRFEEMLGKRASSFINSVVNVYNNSQSLQKCTPASIGAAAIRAASFNLPVDNALGFAAIVPYGNQAQFQLMYKGVTQLCIRSGQYKTIHCTEVFEDEIKFYDPIHSRVVFNDPADYKMRTNGDIKNIVGHYAYFELLSGFQKADYIPTGEAMAHGKKYSKAYQYDIAKSKKSSLWSTDWVVMCNKTILLRLLTKYGVMSVDLQDAIIGERESFDNALHNTNEQIKDDSGSEEVPPVVDSQFEDEDVKPTFL